MEKKMRILFAEDSHADAELFTRALRPFKESKGLVVDHAWSGDEVMAAIKKESYDVLFLDVDMPGPSGIEIFRYIKENHRKEKVVFLTGYSDLNDSFCKRLGVDEYLEKPIDSKTLGEILEKYKPLGQHVEEPKQKGESL